MARGGAQVQLLAPLTPESTIAKFLGSKGPGLQQLAFTVEDVEKAAAVLRARARGCCTTSRAGAPRGRGSTSCTRRTRAASWWNWSNPLRALAGQEPASPAVSDR
nr:hypothetical protein GCM10025732_17450 [Glycomyces mayteni]